ncbi:hypothetical protein F0919_01415 [Taibaiella lutea]|uniref:Lipoprotein n=1 Tax=Taibaiella lutea TaxID=2608001 RepID=A0A5M6CMJ8_9BACT|nr:hypothetical protein [Taibaiella lutea]KAA5536354.1 hypothetical protein F0919_01415 [Taibaiella lutea]
MRVILFGIITLFLSSCYAFNQKVRLYGKCEKGYFVCSQLELRQNNEFEYYVFLDIGGGNTIKGTWKRLGGDTLMLNSYKQPNIPKTYFKAKKLQSYNDSVIIKIQNYFGPFSDEYVYIDDDKQGQLTDNNGICIFKTKEVQHVSFYSIIYSPIIEKITINHPGANYVEIFVKDPETIIPETMTDKLIVAKRNGILFLPKNGDTITYVLKRTRLSKKQWK